MILINSKYETATNELNAQVNTINDIVKKYDENSMLGLGMENDKYLKLEMYNVSNGKAKHISKKVLKRYMDSDALYDYKSIIYPFFA